MQTKESMQFNFFKLYRTVSCMYIWLHALSDPYLSQGGSGGVVFGSLCSVESQRSQFPCRTRDWRAAMQIRPHGVSNTCSCPFHQLPRTHSVWHDRWMRRRRTGTRRRKTLLRITKSNRPVWPYLFLRVLLNSSTDLCSGQSDHPLQ